jgi:hypothetical protein
VGSAAPLFSPGFQEALHDRADLEAAWGTLEGRTDPFADALRGQLRTLELRFVEAEILFARAQRPIESDGSPLSPQDLLRRLLSSVYESELILWRSPPDGQDGPAFRRLTPLPESIAARYPELRLAREAALAVQARFLLHFGREAEAGRLFGRLIDGASREERPRLGEYYLGLAACQRGLGEAVPCRRSLENAELAVLSTDDRLAAGRSAATLAVYYRTLNDRAQSDSWFAFVERLECPAASRAIFRRWAEALSAACVEQGRWVIR